MLNNKGLAISSIIYSILVLFLLLLLSILGVLGSRKLVFDKMKNDVRNELNSGTSNFDNNPSPQEEPQIVYEDKVYTFEYTGGVRTQEIPAGSTCKLEVWGAQGGNSYGNSGGYTVGSTIGANGGYSVGTINLTSDTTLIIQVGGQGGNYSNAVAGYNGGGAGYTYSGNYGSGGGGGASDIRIETNSLYSRAIVAGAGGGAANGWSDTSRSGGPGGGNSGIQIAYGSYSSGSGGTQISGGSGGTSRSSGGNSGSFGQGGAYGLSGSARGGGGGGGWYGAGAGGGGNAEGATGGGGGSGWIYTELAYSTWATAVGTIESAKWLLNSSHYLTDASTVAGNVENGMPTHDGTNTMTGNSGNGYAKITCKIPK